MIKLFVVDLDGCLAYPFQQPNWEAFDQIRQLNEASLKDETIPALSICTGRPQPYAECAAQMLGVRYPLIFESGGGMYNIRTNEMLINAEVTDTHFEQIQKMKQWISQELIPLFPEAYPEFSKMTDCGLVHPHYEAIQQMLEKVKTQLTRLDMQNEFEIHYTEVSINVILRKCNKAAGLHWLGQKIGIDLKSEIAYIGDSGGDVEALKSCSMPFAPSNANELVKAIPNVKILGFETTSAILLAYKKIIHHNRE